MEMDMSPTSTTLSEGRSAQEISTSVEPPLTPTALDAAEARIVNRFVFQFADHQGFEKRLDLTGIVTSSSRVFVSISEIGVIGGSWTPFMGAASMQVHNVVPHDNGIVIVRGYIGWDSNINVRLSVLVA